MLCVVCCVLCVVCVGECSCRWWNKGGHSEVIRMEGRKFLAFCGDVVEHSVRLDLVL